MAFICIGIILLFQIGKKYKNIPDISSILILCVGVIYGFFISGIPRISVMPLPHPIIPTAQEFIKGSWLLALPQAPKSAPGRSGRRDFGRS